MEDAWGYHDEGLLIHILCAHPWGPQAKAVYVYRITRDLSIEPAGVFFQKADVEVVDKEFKTERQEMIRKINQWTQKKSATKRPGVDK
jgi:hypothetical protein